ncbi:unnamed protein product [Linum trigynum]|uniref:Uncharacterized protein n=1 Tax=Linum trigynum TaxID=586398 RepID=A0AAV2E5F4_9ROSI
MQCREDLPAVRRLFFSDDKQATRRLRVSPHPGPGDFLSSSPFAVTKLSLGIGFLEAFLDLGLFLLNFQPSMEGLRGVGVGLKPVPLLDLSATTVEGGIGFEIISLAAIAVGVTGATMAVGGDGTLVVASAGGDATVAAATTEVSSPESEAVALKEWSSAFRYSSVTVTGGINLGI